MAMLKTAVKALTEAMDESIARLVAIGMNAADLQLEVAALDPTIWTIVNTKMGKTVGHGAFVVEWHTR